MPVSAVPGGLKKPHHSIPSSQKLLGRLHNIFVTFMVLCMYVCLKMICVNFVRRNIILFLVRLFVSLCFIDGSFLSLCFLSLSFFSLRWTFFTCCLCRKNLHAHKYYQSDYCSGFQIVSSGWYAFLLTFVFDFFMLMLVDFGIFFVLKMRIIWSFYVLFILGFFRFFLSVYFHS